MNKNVALLLIAQFLSAFADNAILFTAIALILKTGQSDGAYTAILQGSFLVAFVLLAPWVGPYADRTPKTRILIVANLVKAIGALLMLINPTPVLTCLAYAIVGIGAAIYSPAKYGLLPELVGRDELVKANSWIEASTLMAILLGGLVGGFVADRSVFYALLGAIILFGLASLFAALMRNTHVTHQAVHHQNALTHFGQMTTRLLTSPRARFATLGVSLFWATGAVLRVLLVAWAPLVLAIMHSEDIAKLSVPMTIGICIGAALVPFLIPLEQLRKARFAAYAMGLFVLLLSQVTQVTHAYAVLALIGICGGLFVVPINATLQDIGHQTIGSGSAIAIQSFFENLAMLVAVGIYGIASANSVSPMSSMQVLGVIVIVMTVFVALQLPAKVSKN